jgi:hypothetical protein
MEANAVRLRNAADPATAVTRLREYAGDALPRVRAAVARNASTPLALLMELIADDQLGVAMAAMENPAVPYEVRRAVIETAKDTNLMMAATRSEDGAESQVLRKLADSIRSARRKRGPESKHDIRRRALDKMGAALGAEDADLIEAW